MRLSLFISLLASASGTKSVPFTPPFVGLITLTVYRVATGYLVGRKVVPSVDSSRNMSSPNVSREAVVLRLMISTTSVVLEVVSGVVLWVVVEAVVVVVVVVVVGLVLVVVVKVVGKVRRAVVVSVGKLVGRSPVDTPV